jgi:hypothetical protein
MPLNVEPLADGALSVARNIAAPANTGTVMNLKVRIRLCFTLDDGIFCELKQSGCGECI